MRGSLSPLIFSQPLLFHSAPLPCFHHDQSTFVKQPLWETKRNQAGVSFPVHQQYPQSQPISTSAVICLIYCTSIPFTFLNLMQDSHQPPPMYRSHFPAISCLSCSHLFREIWLPVILRQLPKTCVSWLNEVCECLRYIKARHCEITNVHGTFPE